MLAVLLALGVEPGEIEAVRALFMAAAEETRHELDPWESILFEVLKEKAESGADTFEMTAEDVLKAMDIEGDTSRGSSGQVMPCQVLPILQAPAPEIYRWRPEAKGAALPFHPGPYSQNV